MTTIQSTKAKGRGVFATCDINAGTLVESCEVLNLPRPAKNSELDHYVFKYGRRALLALGNGSLYNHSEDPNCEYWFDNRNMHFVLTRAVRHGHEITINYGQELWFEPTT